MKKMFWMIPVALLAVTVSEGAEADAPGARSLTPEARAQYADLVRAELEAGTRQKLFLALAAEHLKRSKADNVPEEKAKWESDLAQEYRDKAVQSLAQFNDSTKARLAFEKEHGAMPAPAAALGSLEETKPLTPNELAYLAKLDELLLSVREEFVRMDETAKGYLSQLHTNTTAEAVGNASVLLELNAKQARQLEREQAELELRKLEFRAVRK